MHVQGLLFLNQQNGGVPSTFAAVSEFFVGEAVFGRSQRHVLYHSYRGRWLLAAGEQSASDGGTGAERRHVGIDAGLVARRGVVMVVNAWQPTHDVAKSVAEF